jgi:chemotaxis family two-component system sensor kinase Cph1
VTQAPGNFLSSESQPYSVKRHGLTITNCDLEPVQTPGCVQAHGVLLVLRLSDLSILQASDNVDPLLGRSVQTLLGQPIHTVIGSDGANQLHELLEKQTADHNPVYLLTLPGSQAGADDLDVTVHTTDGVAVLEFEATGRGDIAQPDYYGLVKTTVARLQTADSLRDLCNVAAGEIRQLTGQDRVMVYKFHADGHGEVIAESRREDLEPWLGLHYPAEDIPKPAREVFKKTWIRPVPDVAGALAELVPLVNPDTGAALNMTHCALRGVSIMYTEYLRNMGVAAALTMAIRKNGQLWGLIACHHYAASKHITYQMRAACEFLAQVVSLQHQAAEEKENVAYRARMESVHKQLIACAAGHGDAATLVSGTPSLLDGIVAGGVAVFHDGHWWIGGHTPHELQLEALKDWLIATRFVPGTRALYVTDHLAASYPPAAAFTAVASGLIALPISPSGRSLILWLRPETLQTVNWGGNPHDKPLVAGPDGPRLSPRHSFALFAESVRERSLPWMLVEVEAAAVLRVSVLDLLASQAEQGIDSTQEMARSNEELDAFAYVASHDLREPLQSIHHYANELLNDAASIGSEARSKLDRMLRLTARMNSLLDSMLQSSRLGGARVDYEPVDLNRIVNEALETVGFRNANNSVILPRPLPMIEADEAQCRQIFVNLLSNALKYSDQTRKQVEVGYIGAGEAHSRPGCPEGSESGAILYVSDNGIGIGPQDFRRVFQLFKRLHVQGKYGGGTGAGLTIVSKLVSQHGGKIWVHSVPGHGATFYFTLPGNDRAHDGSPGQEAVAA